MAEIDVIAEHVKTEEEDTPQYIVHRDSGFVAFAKGIIVIGIGLLFVAAPIMAIVYFAKRMFFNG